MLCSYSEVLGFRGESSQLSDSTSPLHLLATKAGISPLGVAIDLGAAVSMFACVLACTTAAARVLMRMAHGGLLAQALERTNQPPWHAGSGHRAFRGADVGCHRGAGAARRCTGSDMYDWLGSLSVFGFLTAYALVAVALPFARRALGQHSHWVAAISVRHRAGDDSDCDLRSALGERCEPCADSMDLSGLYCGGPGLVWVRRRTVKK